MLQDGKGDGWRQRHPGVSRVHVDLAVAQTPPDGSNNGPASCGGDGVVLQEAVDGREVGLQALCCHGASDAKPCHVAGDIGGKDLQRAQVLLVAEEQEAAKAGALVVAAPG